jgi:aminoglycoside phosphotransferase (APT) family kinase protein
MHPDRDDALLDPAECRLILERMRLIEPSEPFSIQPLTGGVSSLILRISTPRRLMCLKKALAKLKVKKDWYAPVGRVFSEIDWLTTVAGFEPAAVPNIIGVDRASGSFAMDFLPAEEFSNWKALLLQGKVDLDLAATVGRTLGRIHARTAGDAAIAARFANDATFYALRLEPYLVETARVHGALSRTITAVMERTRDTRHVLVHGDVSPKNILVGRKGPVFIDAECACYGDPAFDLAFCINHLLLKAAHLPHSADAFLAAFSRFGEGYFSEVDWEARDAIEARTATLLPCLTLARVDGKSPVEYLDDDRRKAVRAAATKLIMAEAQRLADITDFWSKAKFDGHD